MEQPEIRRVKQQVGEARHHLADQRQELTRWREETPLTDFSLVLAEDYADCLVLLDQALQQAEELSDAYLREKSGDDANNERTLERLFRVAEVVERVARLVMLFEDIFSP